MLQLILASKSVRRFQILSDAGYLPRRITVKISEIIEKNINLEEALSKVATTKARAAEISVKSLKSKDNLIIGADTIVFLKGTVFGKPQSFRQAFETLSSLSGMKHSVKTSIALINCQSGESLTHVESTKVWFRPLSKKEIEDYIETGEPMDKAGAYNNPNSEFFLESFILTGGLKGAVNNTSNRTK